MRLQVLQEQPGDGVLAVHAGNHDHPLTVLVFVHLTADPVEQLLLALLASLDDTGGGVIRQHAQLHHTGIHIVGQAGDPVLPVEPVQGLLAVQAGEVWLVDVKTLTLNMDSIQTTEVTENNLPLCAT